MSEENQKKIIHLIAGARPNFMKIAPLWHALKACSWCSPKIVHTGQHSEVNMSDWFFKDLELGQPDHFLNATTGSHAKVTGSVLIAYEGLLRREPSDLTVVVGDVDSTIACTLAAKKMGIPVAHLEAGLRSFDRTMPEELNRLLVDSVADLLWTPSADGDKHLLNEGVSPKRIQRVGNIMIDSLVRVSSKIRSVNLEEKFGVNSNNPYCVVTLHRPANVDNGEGLAIIVDRLLEVSKNILMVFPIHPRTKNKLNEFDLMSKIENSSIKIVAPLGYIDFNALINSATFLLTDSGGIQEESTYMGVPCLTLRPNTERPITITEGTNKLVSIDDVLPEVAKVISNPGRKDIKIDLWDGDTASRVVKSVKGFLNA